MSEHSDAYYQAQFAERAAVDRPERPTSQWVPPHTAEPVIRGDEIVCETCGRVVWIMSSADGDSSWTEHR